MRKKNSISKKIFCHPYRESQARQYRTDHHPDFNVIVDHNANPDWLYIVMPNGKIYHHFVGVIHEDKSCQIH